MVHIGIHIAGLTLSSFLLILAIHAYKNLKTTRMMLTSISFSMFVSAEIVTLIDATWPSMYDLEYITMFEIGHILLIITLGILAIGVFRND